ncbi:MAG: hypothetical protein R1F52_05700 [Candidatus Nitrosoabyssus spongiisocia]|nr:MAG: hypothetical protein R1F52_05700 [Nitrosopumilaceae archaeon AB1(1)]
MMESTDCEHKVAYFGVTNINIEEKTIGSVDIWRCALCKKIFCEEKQLGIEAIAEVVGMPLIKSDEKWGVSICKLQKGKDRWKLVKLSSDGLVKHECIEERIMELNVKNYSIDDPNHQSFLIQNHVNNAVEI